MMWLLEWWPYALSHHLNPFLTDYVWAPVGFNFAWMTSIPLPALLAAPLTALDRDRRSLQFLALLGAPLRAFAPSPCAVGSRMRSGPRCWAASCSASRPSCSAQTLGHLCLILSFPVPLAAYLVLDGSRAVSRTRRFIALMAAFLTSEFLIDMEMFATATVVGTRPIAIGFRFSSRELRQRAVEASRATGVALAITIVLVSPYLYYFFVSERCVNRYGRRRNSRPTYSISLSRHSDQSGRHCAGVARLASRFTGPIMERDGFIALPLIRDCYGMGSASPERAFVSSSCYFQASLSRLPRSDPICRSTDIPISSDAVAGDRASPISLSMRFRPA